MGEVFHHVSIFAPRRPGGLWTATSGPLAKSLVGQPSDNLRTRAAVFPHKIVSSGLGIAGVMLCIGSGTHSVKFVDTIQSQMHDSATHVHTLIPTLAKTIITLDAVSP